MNRSRRLLLAALAALCSAPSQAADANETEVIVTATRVAQTADESLASVTVIDRDDLDRRQPKDMIEVLRMVPGIDLARTGGPGGDTSIFLRGSNSNHVLVMIDGVRAASATTGAFAWQHLQPAAIERIEIVRGPRAALYGSDAIGGVIQIFTRQVGAPYARVEAGSFGTRRLQADIGGGTRARWHIGAETSEADGFSSQNSNGGTYDPDDDGYENISVNAGLDVDVNAATQLSLSLWHSASDVEFDVGTTESINQTFQARLTHAAHEQWIQTLTLGHTLDELDTLSSFPSTAETRRISLDWQNDLAFGSARLLTVGLSFYEDDARNIDRLSDSTVFDRDADNTALFAQFQHTGAEHDLQLAVRRDKHSAFGGETTGQAAWGYRLDATTRLIASYGTAFRAPNINDLYHPGFDFFGTGTFLYAGNPNLNPETSKSLEVGLRWQLSPSAEVRATMFRTDIDNLIAFEGTNAQAVNINRAAIKGMEVEYGIRKGNWEAVGSLTLQDARDRDNDTRLLRRPDSKASLQITHGGERWDYGGEILLSAQRDELNFNTFPATRIQLPGYGLLNLFAVFRVTRELTMEARIENLTDKAYELAYGYNTPGRSLSVALRYAPRG